jgi:hypothetical protein
VSTQDVVTYRTRQAARVAAITGIVACAVCVSFCVALIVNKHLSIERRTLGSVFILAMCAPFAWACYRSATACVRTSDAGVVVRNILRTRFVPWTCVTGFETVDIGWGTLGYMNRTDGKPIPLLGISGRLQMLFPKDDWAAGPISDLERERRAHQGTT